MTDGIRAIGPGDHGWTPTGERDPDGLEAVAFRSADGRGAWGLWERGAQEQPEAFVREYHEVAYIIEGEVEISTDDGRTVRAGPGDVLVTPKGARGTWRNLSPVRKFWAIDRER